MGNKYKFFQFTQSIFHRCRQSSWWTAGIVQFPSTPAIVRVKFSTDVLIHYSIKQLFCPPCLKKCIKDQLLTGVKIEVVLPVSNMSMFFQVFNFRIGPGFLSRPLFLMIALTHSL
jgi:hypothetical protein